MPNSLVITEKGVLTRADISRLTETVGQKFKYMIKPRVRTNI